MARSERRSDRMRSIEAISVRESQDLAGQMERQAQVVRDAEQRLQELASYLDSYAAEQAEKSQAEGVSAMQLTGEAGDIIDGGAFGGAHVLCGPDGVQTPLPSEIIFDL